jgi:hypothetical protein
MSSSQQKWQPHAGDETPSAGSAVPLRGTCRLCGSRIDKAQMTNHLKACLASHAAPAAGQPSGRCFHLVVDGGKYAPEYWLHVAAPAEATFGDLDRELRDIWLECCGHMSAFRFPQPKRQRGLPVDFNALVAQMMSAEAELDAEQKLMSQPLAAKLRARMTFTHEYDFGTTTTLVLRVVGEWPLAIDKKRRRSRLRLLARNEPPPIPCGVCGKPATAVCAQCLYDGTGWVCITCAPQHDCGEDMLLPNVNSPRVGQCGYCGPSREP